MRPSLVPVPAPVYTEGVTNAGTVESAVDTATRVLAEAAASGVPCPPVRALIGADDIGVAYRVQSDLIARRVDGGAVRVGRKIGLTSPAVQRQLGVDRPDFGVLLDDMAVPNGGIVPTGRLLQPKAEAEVAFRLDADLDGELTAATVHAAVASMHAAVEIVDSRIAGWDIAIADTIADNASSGMFAISEHGVPLAAVEPAEVRMVLRLNGQVASTGDGCACLGDPLTALLWLARTAAEFGDPLRAGELVLSGALGPMVSVRPGDRVDAEISGLGSVGVEFGAEQ